MKATIFWTNLALALTLLPIGNLSAAEASAATVRGEAVAVCVEKSPVMDGTLQDPLWEKCPAWPIGTCTSENQQKYATWAKVLFGPAHVYVGVYCEEPDTAGLAAKIAKRDGPVWEDDAVEVFLRPDPQEAACQFVVNPLGTLYDAHDKNPAYNSTAEVKAHVEKGKAWTVTLKIPMREIGAYVGEDQMWTLNVYRTRQARGGDPILLYSWSIMSDADYHNAREFGVVTGVKVPKTEGGVTRIRATPAPRRLIPNRGKPSDGVIVYHSMHFDEGLEGWEGSNGARVSLSNDAISGQALRVACEKGWAAAQLPLAINGSKDLKMALLMKGRNLPVVGVNIHDAASGDNTTPYAHRYLRDGGWTPILYRLDRCRYNSTTEGYVGRATQYDGLHFYGPREPKPGTEFIIDDLVIYRGTDRQPPAKVAGLAAQATSGGVQLSWQPAADNVGVQVYVIARADGGGGFCKIAESYATTYHDAAAPKGSCRYRVFAVDFEENFGPWSKPATVTSVSKPRKAVLAREEEDRLGYAGRIAAIHAQVPARSAKGMPRCLVIRSPRQRSIRSARIRLRHALGRCLRLPFDADRLWPRQGQGDPRQGEPRIPVHSLWHEQQQGAEGPAVGHGGPGGDRQGVRRQRHGCWAGHDSAPGLGARLAARGRLQRRVGQAVPEAKDPDGLHLRGFPERRARQPPQVPGRRWCPLGRRGHGNRRAGLGQDARPDPVRFAGPEVTKPQTWFFVLLRQA